MKIAVLGAGALGLLYGGLLSKNNDVTLFEVTDEAVETINKKGVTVDNCGNVGHYTPKSIKSGKSKEVFDLVLVSVKTLYTESTLEANKAIIGPNTYLMTIQNGLGNKEVLAKFTDSSHLILGITRTNSIKVDYATAKRVNSGITEIGYTNTNYEFVNALKSNLISSGIETTITPNIDHEIWSKLFLNIITNPLSAIYDCTLGNCYSNPELNELSKKIIKEAILVAEASGESFDFNEVFKNNMELCQEASEGRPSMWQDVKNKRKTEIEFINGAIVRLGKKYHIATPVNKMITDKIHEIEDKYNCD